MKIAKNVVVTASYTLTDAQNNVIEESQEPMVYLHGDYDNIFPKIEQALDGQEVGYSTTVQLEPEDAFGEYDAELIKVEPRSAFPDALEIGMQFEGVPDGAENQDESHIFTVTDIADGKVVLDGNHPLAGMALRFTMKVEAVREASEVEITHGHVHGEHGHHHDDEDDSHDEYRTQHLH